MNGPSDEGWVGDTLAVRVVVLATGGLAPVVLAAGLEDVAVDELVDVLVDVLVVAGLEPVVVAGVVGLLAAASSVLSVALDGVGLAGSCAAAEGGRAMQARYVSTMTRTTMTGTTK